MEMAAKLAKTDIAGRIDATGWGLLFLMTGALALIPGVPDGTWVAGFGVLLMGLNATRFALGLRVDWFTVIVGSGAFVIGLARIAGIDLPWFALGLILCGLAIVIRQFVQGR